MLKGLVLTVLLLTLVACVEDDQNQYESPVVRQYWSHAPVHSWTRFAKFRLFKNDKNLTKVEIKMRVNLYNFPADTHLKRIYKLYGLERNWWAASCIYQRHRQTGEPKGQLIMDTIGTPDVMDAFLLSEQGNVISTLQDYNRMTSDKKMAALERGHCWSIYHDRRVPYQLKWIMNEDPEIDWTDWINDCIVYKPFYIMWKQDYGECIDKSIVTHPEMLKHLNRGSK